MRNPLQSANQIKPLSKFNYVSHKKFNCDERDPPLTIKLRNSSENKSS